MPKSLRINTNVAKSISRELEYVYDDETRPVKRPKWQYPPSEEVRLILEAVHRKYFKPDEKDLRHKIVLITRAMMPMSSGVLSKYPAEWVKNCCDWASTKWAKGEPITLKGLVTLLSNEDSRAEFVASFCRKNKLKLTPVEGDDES